MGGHSHESTGPTKPLNVEQIVHKAQSFDYNPLIPLRYWLRTAGTLLKEAEIYEREGNDQQTYLLLYRHAQLVIRNLSTHPEAKEPHHKSLLAKATKDVNSNLQKLEALRPRINKRFERYEQLVRNRDARQASSTSKQASLPRSRDGLDGETAQARVRSDPALSHETETLIAGENRDLAVKLAHKEIRRRATERKATRQAGISEEVENERRTAGVWGNWEEALTQDNETLNQDTLHRQMQNVRSQINGTSSQEPPGSRSRPMGDSIKSRFQYPSVPDRNRNATARRIPSFTADSPLERSSESPPPPELPPKDRNLGPLVNQPPLRPGKEPLSSETSSVSSAVATPNQDLQPSALTFKPSAYLENGSPLRTIFLPPDLRHRFLSIAEANTRAKLETCGILCGTLISNALFISKLVIPEQTSTSDTCETVNESDLFDYVDGEDLLVLGWIHTHPTQTCFMSSRDLHTHGGYQVMMPESIAIVCAPSKGEWGVFRLTDPPGMKSILNCTQTGLFHPHAENNIYTDALRPGHVFEARGLEFDVIDLRP